jgi:outer membrane protein assembly factor BamB
MKEIYRIPGVKSFAAGTQYLALREGKDIVKIANSANGDTIETFDAGQGLLEIYMKEDVAWVNTLNGNGFYISNLQWTDAHLLIKDIIPGSDLVFYGSKAGKGIKATANGSVLWEIDEKFFVFYAADDKFFYARNKHELVAIDDRNGTLLWKFIVPQTYEWKNDLGDTKQVDIRRIIGTYNNVLWLTLSSGRLLGVNISTGQLLYNITGPAVTPAGYTPRENNAYVWFGEYSQLDNDKGILFGFRDRYYWEIDVANPVEKFILYDVKNTAGRHQLVSGGPVYEYSWSGNKIYFWEGSTNNKFGVFDRALREITWSGEIKEAKGLFPAVRNVLYADGQLYVLDGNNVLIVYAANSM